MVRSIYLAIPVMFVLVILQTAVLPYFPVVGLSPQLPFLIALAWALVRGLEEGLVWAFVGGLFVDILSMNLVGINALAYLLSLASVLWIRTALPESRLLLPVVMSGLATTAYILVFAVFMNLWGQNISGASLSSVSPLILLHAVFIIPVYWLLYGIDRILRPRPVKV